MAPTTSPPTTPHSTKPHLVTLTPATPLYRLAHWLRTADRILVGAGLSAAAGLDYNDTTSFARDFPALAARGIRTRYEMIGRHLPAELHWAYLAGNARAVRFDPDPNPLYRQLRELEGDTDHFVWTSNVAGLFARNGFAPERVFAPQSDYALHSSRPPIRPPVPSPIPPSSPTAPTAAKTYS